MTRISFAVFVRAGFQTRVTAGFQTGGFSNGRVYKPAPTGVAVAYDPEIHHRRSIRLRGYDYSQPGMYFVTICTHNKEHLFGEIVDGEMIPNEHGLIINQCWHRLPRHYPHAEMDSFVLMPNHVHGIIAILLRGGFINRGGFVNPPLHPLSEIVRGFKTYSARRVNVLRRTPSRALWQRNYYEHIVRNDDELNKIREYIRTNPLRWGSDPENL
jgi:REP element-mobilizing transposase RayT